MNDHLNIAIGCYLGLPFGVRVVGGFEGCGVGGIDVVVVSSFTCCSRKPVDAVVIRIL